MKVLIDMNLSPDRANFPHRRSIEASHRSSLGRAAAPDSELMPHARRNGYIVLTQDLDFGVLLALTEECKPSVIQLRIVDVSPDINGAIVVNAARHLALELEQGAVLTIDSRRTRLRLLPIGMRDQR